MRHETLWPAHSPVFPAEFWKIETHLDGRQAVAWKRQQYDGEQIKDKPWDFASLIHSGFSVYIPSFRPNAPSPLFDFDSDIPCSTHGVRNNPLILGHSEPFHSANGVARIFDYSKKRCGK
jgi:hypothetical protein